MVAKQITKNINLHCEQTNNELILQVSYGFAYV